MPRALAANVIEEILFHRKSFDDAFASVAGIKGSVSSLSGRDRAFAYNIVATTLRRLGQIDDLIDTCLEKQLPSKARSARTILRLGAAQLLFMDVSAHAAVGEIIDSTNVPIA